MQNLPAKRSNREAVTHADTRPERAAWTEDGDSGREFMERLLDGIYRQRWTVVAAFVLTVGVVSAYSFLKQPEYDASSLILLDLKDRWSRVQDDGSSTGDFFAENNRTLNGELYVIKASGRIAERVNERVASIAGVRSAPDRSPAHVQFLPAEEQIDAIRVVATSTDPEKAALLANLYAEEYVRLTKDASLTNASTSREMLEQQEQKHKAELQSIEREIQQYLQKHATAGLDQTSGHIVSQIANLEAQRDNTQIELRQTQASLESLQAEIKKINPSIERRLSSSADEAIKAYQQQIAKLEIDRDAIRMKYPNSENEEVKARLGRIEGQLQQLRTEVQSRSKEYVQDVLQDGGLSADQNGVNALANLSQRALTDRIAIEGMRARLNVVEDRLASYKGQLQTLPQQSMELAQLERKKQHTEQMYNLVVQRLQHMTVDDESNAGYARILREASVPAVPARPNRGRNILLAGVFGLLLGCGIGAVRERIDNRIYRPDVILHSGNAVLGVIPDMKPLLTEDHGGADRVVRDGKSTASNLVMMHNPLSAVAEAYRQARTNVLFGRDGRQVQTLLVTGPGITDGKTVTATNLAIALAQAGHRTLLIDADLRRPEVHNRFGLPGIPGLVDALQSEDTPAASTPVDNLFVLPAGVMMNGQYRSDADVIEKPAELLGSKEMRNLLQRLKKEYDVIIVDTPPVLAATDAAVLSTQVDAALLVVRAGKTRESELAYALQALEDVHAPVIGALLNGFSLAMAYGYSYRYPGYTKYGMYSKYGYNGHDDQPKREFKPTAWVRLGVETIKDNIELHKGRTEQHAE